MSWVRRAQPGDPAYFCDCPPCPFCFEWVDDKGNDAPRRKRRRRALSGDPPRREHPRRERRQHESSAAGERSLARRLALPALAGIAFLLTVGVGMRHQAPWTTSSRPNPRVAAPTSPVANFLTPPPPVARNDAASDKMPSVPAAPISPPASSAEDPGTAQAAGAPDPGRQEPIPVRLAVKSSPDSGVSISLRNGTRAPLDLKVTAVDPASGSQSMVAVNIPGLATVDLTRAGLVAEHGYQLTLESPGYVSRELMVQ